MNLFYYFAEEHLIYVAKYIVKKLVVVKDFVIVQIVNLGGGGYTQTGRGMDIGC